jgi:hypothetical protein
MTITPVRTVQDWAVEYDIDKKDFYLTGVGLDKSDVKVYKKDVLEFTKSHLKTTDTIYYVDNPNTEFVTFCLERDYPLNIHYPLSDE